MKGLVDFILEELDSATLHKINAQREKNKKEALVAMKRGLAKKDPEDLKRLAETVYAEIGNYEDPDDLWNAYEADDLKGYKELEDLVKQANGNKEVDFDKMCDLVELLANGDSLDRAIATLAKKI